MKMLIAGLIMMGTYHASATSCDELAKQRAVEQAAQEFALSKTILKADFVTSEALDGDVHPSDEELYVDKSFEVYEVKNTRTNKVVATYSVSMVTISNYETGAFVRCEAAGIQNYEEKE